MALFLNGIINISTFTECSMKLATSAVSLNLYVISWKLKFNQLYRVWLDIQTSELVIVCEQCDK